MSKKKPSRWAISNRGSINVRDLAAADGRFVGTIREVKEKKGLDGNLAIDIFFNECQKPFSPCYTLRVMLDEFMPEGVEKWKGETIELYLDPSVMFGADNTGGVRIRATSAIKQPYSKKILIGRRYQTITIYPIKTTGQHKQPPPEQKK